MEVRNAIISSVSLDDADRGFLTGWIHLDYGGSIAQALERLERIMARPVGKLPHQDPFPDHPKFHAIKGGRLS